MVVIASPLPVLKRSEKMTQLKYLALYMIIIAIAPYTIILTPSLSFQLSEEVSIE